MTFSSFRRMMAGVLTLAVMLTLASCGSLDRAPVATSSPESLQGLPQSGVSYIAFSPTAPFRAAKYNDGGTLVDSDLIGPTGDVLQVEDLGDAGDLDDLTLRFEVFAGGLDSNHQITMTVTKGTLSQIVAAFEPVGLNFLIDSELQFIVGNELVDVDLSALIAYHIHGDGSVEHANMWVEVVGDKTIVHVKVPGFSRYTIDD